MSCGADGPLGRPAFAPPTPGFGLSRAWLGMRWRGQAQRGEAAGGRLVTGRETKEGRRSARGRSGGTRAKRFVLDIVHDRVDQQHRSHRAPAAGSCFATVMAGEFHRRRDGEDAGSGFEFGSRFDDMPRGARGFGVNG